MASRIAMPDDGSQEMVELTLSGAALLTRLLLGVINNTTPEAMVKRVLWLTGNGGAGAEGHSAAGAPAAGRHGQCCARRPAGRSVPAARQCAPGAGRRVLDTMPHAESRGRGAYTERCTAATAHVPSGVCTVRQREDSHCLELQAAPGSPALQDAVSQLCCAVWTAKVEGREAVVAQTLPYLIIRALTSGGLRRMQRAWQRVQHMQRAEPANGVPVRWSSSRPRAN